MEFFNLLLQSTSAATSAAGEGTTKNAGFNPIYLIYIAVIVLLIVWMFFSYRRRKKEQEAIVEKVNSLAVGDKVKTIGMMVGTIAEVSDDGTLLLNVGTEECPGYVRIDRQGIYQFTKKSETKPDEQSNAETAEVFDMPAEEGATEEVATEGLEASAESTEIGEVSAESTEAQEVKAENENTNE